MLGLFELFRCGAGPLNTVPLLLGELDTARIGRSHEQTHFDGRRQYAVQANFGGILEGQHLRTCRLVGWWNSTDLLVC